MAPPVHEILEENEQLKVDNRILSLRVKTLERELFGSRSDKRPHQEDPAQSTLEGIEEATAWEESQEPVTERKKSRKHRGKKKGPKPINKDLPRVEESVPAPDLKDLICPVTGKPMRSAFTETIEVLARKPAEHYVRRITRTVFTGSSQSAPVYSPWPRDVLPKSRIDASVIAHVLTARFADHQPYHRQCKQFARHGLEFSPNTLCSLTRQAYDKLNPICEHILQGVRTSGYIQLDPTPIPLLSKQKPGSVKQACMWTYRALDGPVYFEFSETKSGKTPAHTLKNYQGILQTDGANNFGGVPQQPGVVHMNCWAHLRRYFLQAELAGEKAATPYLEDIDKLFRIERLARHFKLRSDKLGKLRERHSIPMVDTIFERARAYIVDERMIKTPLPKAVLYTLPREKTLRECFGHAPSRIDNNLAENSLRPLKLGARNWLFVGHANAGPRAAAMFTLVENCRLAGINPEAYFIDVLARVDDHLASRIDELTPHNWGQSTNR
jgi:transposase